MFPFLKQEVGFHLLVRFFPFLFKAVEAILWLITPSLRTLLFRFLPILVLIRDSSDRFYGFL